MNGSITRRGKTSWRIKHDLPRDPQTGERRIAYATVKGRRADAEKELRQRLTAIDKGMHVDPRSLTVADYLDSWLDDVAPASVQAKALERYSGLVRNQIKPALGAIQLQKLRPADVAAFHQQLCKGSLAVRTIRHAHGVLRTALGHAALVELVERNVAALVKPPKLDGNKEIEILDGEQITDALSKLQGLSIYPIAVLAFATGARRGELCGLRWSDFDLDNASVRIERSIEQTKAGLRVKLPKTKAGRRTVSLPMFAVKVIRDHKVKTLETRLAVGAGALPPDGWVFGNLAGHMPNPYTVSDRWRNAVKNRKLPKVTFHALRHSHASALIAAGLDVVTVSRRLGHAKPTVTLAIYSHLFENKDGASAAALDAVLAL